ncbi:glycoside hydrolase family 16 protein [Archangium violaceum]|uniref:glycoside hydrolase family 16 protein n=1 Tax=Archangium violaceum TaxID=83451 RepID=UPI00193B4F1F|nr:glycoside hydrolase family 16 protein [Archangium violaceum]QRK10940.1 glycoside hydrolase family 16 protein [Archangium violaceum]
MMRSLVGRGRGRCVRLACVVGLSGLLGMGCGPEPEVRALAPEETRASTAAATDNLLANGGFEQDLQGWKTWQASLSRILRSSDAPEGGYVVKVTPVAGTSGGYSLEAASSVVAAPAALGTYTASAYVAAASTSAVGKTVILALRETDASGVVRVWEQRATLTQTFQKVTVSATLEQTDRKLSFYILQTNSVSGDALYADDIRVTAPGTPPGWRLVFQDDFLGSAVDTTQWSMYYSPGHGGNGLRRPSAFSVANGLLTVTAQMVDGTLVSGGMSHKSNYKYGRFEFRVRTEPDPSGTTSGVVLTWPQSGNWPSDGENDIYETGTGTSRASFSTFIHYGADNRQYHYRHAVDATQWHTVAMEWEPEALRIFRDGALVWTLTDVNAIPDVAHHLCIQLDAFRTTMGAPVKMYVDWVKIYQR